MPKEGQVTRLHHGETRGGLLAALSGPREATSEPAYWLRGAGAVLWDPKTVCAVRGWGKKRKTEMWGLGERSREDHEEH